MRRNFEEDYFNWMYDTVCGGRLSDHISFRQLLKYLHNTEFVYSIARDRNRASDGIDLRYRFADEYDYDISECKTRELPCSVLEMMVALALRCEETIMDNPKFGNRTSQWFWTMVTNLGLGGMIDERFEPSIVKRAVNRLLDRKYDPDGKGGLFRIRDCEDDLRDVEIWVQLCWYLNTIT